MYVTKLPVTTFAGLRYDDDEDILCQRSGAYVHLCPTGGGLTGSTAGRTPCVPQMVDHDGCTSSFPPIQPSLWEKELGSGGVRGDSQRDSIMATGVEFRSTPQQLNGFLFFIVGSKI